MHGNRFGLHLDQLLRGAVIAVSALAIAPLVAGESDTNVIAERGVNASREQLRAAGIVLKWLRTDKAANCSRAEKLIIEAARKGAKLVCTTECFLDGYAIQDKSIPLDQYRALAEPIPDGEYF
jgi:hypothetical protein